MTVTPTTVRRHCVKILASMAGTLFLALFAASAAQKPSSLMQFPLGTATPSELCGACHKAIYREFATGFGSDLEYKAVVYESADGKPLTLPANLSATATLHALAGVDPFPGHARTVEEEGRQCDVCHFPQPFEIPD